MSQYKRKYDGAPMKDLRREPAEYTPEQLRRGDTIPQPSPGISKPPHKRQRVYRLKVTWSETESYKIEKSYLTKHQRDEAIKLFKKDLQNKNRSWRWLWGHGYRDVVKTPLKIEESMEDQG